VRRVLAQVEGDRFELDHRGLGALTHASMAVPQYPSTPWLVSKR
jgi:hypothetical protein